MELVPTVRASSLFLAIIRAHIGLESKLLVPTEEFTFGKNSWAVFSGQGLADGQDTMSQKFLGTTKK